MPLNRRAFFSALFGSAAVAAATPAHAPVELVAPMVLNVTDYKVLGVTSHKSPGSPWRRKLAVLVDPGDFSFDADL